MSGAELLLRVGEGPGNDGPSTMAIRAQHAAAHAWQRETVGRIFLHNPAPPGSGLPSTYTPYPIMNANLTFPRVSRSAGFWRGLGALLLSTVSLPAFAQFVPGSGGTVPDVAPFVDPVGSIGGLRIYRSHRRNDFIGSGNHPVIDFEFFPPSVFGATAHGRKANFDNTFKLNRLRSK